MATTLKPIALRRVEGGWEFAYEIDGHRRGIVFGDLSAVRDWLKGGTPADEEEQMLRLAVRTWLARDANLTNFAGTIRNKTLTLDAEAANILTIA